MRTKRVFAAALAACLFFGVVASSTAGAAAAKKKRHERRVEDSYATPAALVDAAGAFVGACAHGGSGPTRNLGCVAFPTTPTERFLELEIVDATGLPAPAWVVQEDSDTGGPVCGKTDKPMRIARGVEIFIWIYPYMLSPLCPGVSTTGTVKATLSNLP